MAVRWMKPKASFSGQAVPIHQDLFGLVDDPAGHDLVLGSVGGLLGFDGPFLTRPGQDVGDGGQQLTGLEGLDQVGGHPRVPRLLNEVTLAEGGEQEHGHLMTRGDLPGGPDAVHARHLHVEDREVGLLLFDQLHGLVAPAGLTDHFVAGRNEDLLEVEPDDRFVFGDHDAGQRSHGVTLLRRPIAGGSPLC